MTVADLDKPEDSKPQKDSGIVSRMRGLLIIAALVAPLLLFGAAMLVGLGFYFTGNPIFGTITIVLVIAATLLAVVAAFLVPRE